MTEDELIMYSSSILLFVLIAVSFRFKKLFGIINGCIFAVYTAFFLYGLNYLSAGGVALVWWFFLLVFTWAHSIIVGIYLIVKSIKKKQRTTMHKE